MTLIHHAELRRGKRIRRGQLNWEVLADTKQDRTLLWSYESKWPYVLVACNITMEASSGMADWEESVPVGYWNDLIWLYGTRKNMITYLRKKGTI